MPIQLRTSVCDMLDVKYPIFAFTHKVPVVIAISKAGGFPVYGATRDTPEEIEQVVREVRAAIGQHTQTWIYGSLAALACAGKFINDVKLRLNHGNDDQLRNALHRAPARSAAATGKLQFQRHRVTRDYDQRQLHFRRACLA